MKNQINIKALKSAIENNNNGMQSPFGEVKQYQLDVAKRQVEELGFETSQVNINHFIYWMQEAEVQICLYWKGLLTLEQLDTRYAAQKKKFQAPFAQKSDKIGSLAYMQTIIVNLQENN